MTLTASCSSHSYRREKMVERYKTQVARVIWSLNITERVTTEVKRKQLSLYLLLRQGKDGVTLLNTWLSYAVEKYQPGTVRFYLISLRLFYYKFLIQERKPDIPDVSVDTLNVCSDLMTSWSAAQRKRCWRESSKNTTRISRNLFQANISTTSAMVISR